MKLQKNVEKIDEMLVKEIETLHTELAASKDATNELQLNLDSAKGEIEDALKIDQILHSNPKIIPVTHSTGTLDPAGTALAAAGMPGRRTAERLTYFTINEGQPYGKDTLPEDLDPLDYAVYDTLKELTGKPKLIMEKMKSGGKFLAVVAKKCNLIDDVVGFVNIFAKKSTGTEDGNNAAKDGKSKTTNESETDNVKDSPENETKSPAKPRSSSGRSSKSSDAETSGSERGRNK